MSHAAFLQALFLSLAGTWALDRDLASNNADEPAGKCRGTATFVARIPSPVVDPDGKLHLAVAEMLYHETGEFQLPNHIKVPFSKKYIWRLTQNIPKISLWFTKPGTEQIDYLFHDIDLHEDTGRGEARGTGGHLCVDDFYSTAYAFQIPRDSIADQHNRPAVASWETVHEVQGPKKDQTLTTRFTRQ